MVNAFKGYEALLFDIDGVLVDTRKSYRAAIAKTVGKFLEIKKIPEKPRMKVGDVALFKSVRGFNNDWAVSRAAAAYYALRKAGGRISLRGYCEKIRGLGGGTGGARALLAQSAVRAEWLDERDDVKVSLLVRIFQERYAGGKNFKRLYSLEPEYFKGRGLIEKETLLLKPALFRKLAGKYALAVVTGRPRFEMDYVLEKGGLKKFFQSRIAFEDVKNGKPHPEPILLALRLLGAGKEKACYIGDAVDDAISAKAAGVDFYGVAFAKENARKMAGEFKRLGAKKVFENPRALERELEASLKIGGRK